MRFEVDVKPLAPRAFGGIDRSRNKACPQAMPSIGRVHGRIKKEGVRAAVGRHVDESNQPVAIECAEEAQASLKDIDEAAWPVIRPRRSEERIERLIIERGISYE